MYCKNVTSIFQKLPISLNNSTRVSKPFFTALNGAFNQSNNPNCDKPCATPKAIVPPNLFNSLLNCTKFI